MATAKRNRKAQLLSEATRLFSEHGYDKVTVKQLGDICGITEPAVYRHFASKETLYDAVLESLESRIECAKLFSQLEREVDLKKILVPLATFLVRAYSRNRDLCRLLLFTSLRNPGKSRKLFEEAREKYVTFLSEQLHRLHRRKAIAKRNFDLIAQSFVAMAFECALSQSLWRRHQGASFKSDEILNCNVTMYIKGMEKTNRAGK